MSDFLKEHDVEYKRNLRISEISSIRIGGVSDITAYPKSEKEFIDLVDFLTCIAIPYKIIGRMTNILASDDGFRGVLISTKRLVSLSFDGVIAYAECGVAVSSLLFSAAKLNLGGLEALFGIPGTLGGLLHNNGGAGDFDISHALLYARVYSPLLKKILFLDSRDLKLEYRSSIFFKCDFVILSEAIAFVNGEYNDIIQKIRLAAEKRKANQPLSYPSLGSVFKRENGMAVSKLIDTAGLKGVRIGGAQISKKHAGFIINRGYATCNDVLELIDLVKEKIFEKYGFVPKEEIEFLA